MPFIPRYKVGDVVCITGHTLDSLSDEPHNFDKGDVVTITTVDVKDAKLPYRCQGSKVVNNTDWIHENDCELEYGHEERKATSENVRALDIVRLATDAETSYYLLLSKRDPKGPVGEAWKVARLSSTVSGLSEGSTRNMGRDLLASCYIVSNLGDVIGEVNDRNIL